MASHATNHTLLVQETGLTRHQGARLSVFRTEYRQPEPGSGEPQLAVKLLILEPNCDARRELLFVGDQVSAGGDTLRVERITPKSEGGPIVFLRRAA